SDRISDTLRVRVKNNNATISTPLRIEAAVQNGYRAVLPNSRKAFLLENQVTPLSSSLRTISLTESRQLYKQPNELAARINELPAGAKLTVIGDYNGFYLIEGQERGWILQ